MATPLNNLEVTVVLKAIDDIHIINSWILDFWRDGGWGSHDSTDLLSRSRLDLQVHLSESLTLWLEPLPTIHEDCRLIFAWVNLGALIEGSIKWFLSVYVDDYMSTAKKPKNNTQGPESLILWKLIEFLHHNVWTAEQSKRWRNFLILVKDNRNCIHSYSIKELGNIEDFCWAIILYREFLLELEGSVPYPEYSDEFSYPTAIRDMRFY